LVSRKVEVVEENGVGSSVPDSLSEERVERLVALGRALSDPIRVRMLGMMAEGLLRPAGSRRPGRGAGQGHLCLRV
jgi:hypothetical protein